MPAAASLERKQLTLGAVAISDADTGSFKGLASTYEVDAYNDIVVPGAYRDTIPKFLRDGFIAWGHDDLTPVAYPTNAYEDARGLWIEAKFHSTPAAQEARQIAFERMAAQKRVGLSIGYYPTQTESAPDGTRRLLAVDLVETSLVMSPAADNARVSEIKAAPEPEPPPPPAPDPCTTAAQLVTALRALAPDDPEHKAGARNSGMDAADMERILAHLQEAMTLMHGLMQPARNTAPIWSALENRRFARIAAELAAEKEQSA